MTNPRTCSFRRRNAVAVAFAILSTCTLSAVAQSPNVVVRWNDAALQGVRDSKLGPPMVARALFIVHNCIFDAWAAYDRTAVGTVFGRSLRCLSCGSGLIPGRQGRSVRCPDGQPWVRHQ